MGYGYTIPRRFWINCQDWCKGFIARSQFNPETRETVKVGFDCTIPLNRDKSDFARPKPGMKVKLDEYLE